MNGDLIPAVAAAGGGGALLGTIAAYEYRHDKAMRASRETYRVTFPLQTKAAAAEAALRAMAGLGHQYELVLEVSADEHGVRQLLHAPLAVAESAVKQVEAAIPGIRIEPASAPEPEIAPVRAVRFLPPALGLLRTDDIEQASRALLGALAALRPGDRVSLKWALRPGPSPTPDPQLSEPQQRLVRQRSTQPGFVVAGLLMVTSQHASHAAVLARHVEAVVRGRRVVGAGMLMRSARVSGFDAMPSTYRRRGWLSASEIAGLLGWPLGDEVTPGVEVGAARRRPVPRRMPRSGRPLFSGFDAHGTRPVALPVEAACHHVAVVGPSGVGKSALLARGVLADMASGHGGVLVDPKADTASAVLDRVPVEHADRVVVLDPAAAGPVPGLDLFATGDPDLRTDVVLGALAALFKDAWGPRTEQYLRLGLRTIASQPAPLLLDWPRLFTDRAFRAQAVGRLTDPLLRMAWANFEELSPAEQAQHIAPGLNRLVGLLARPAVRNVLAQERPKLDVGRLLEEGKWLVVPLSPGALGEGAARLLGSVLMYAVWSAIEARATLPPAKRRPAFIVLDELQALESLPFNLEYLFERSRGLRCGLSVATQALGRLPERTRESLLGNVGTLVSFRLGYDEAAKVSRELPGLTAADLQALAPFEVAARVGTGLGSSVAVMTGRTEPLPDPHDQAQRIRVASAERYGGLAASWEAAAVGPGNTSGQPLGRRRRAS